MAFNDIFRLRVHCRQNGGEVLNVLHFVDNFGVPGDSAQYLANDFRDQMGTTLRARACPDLVFEFVEVIKIVPYGDGPRVALWAANTNGTATGNSFSATLAEVVTVYTGTAGRRHRGRMYLAGAPTGTSAAGSWPAAQTTRTQTFVTALMNRYGPAATNIDFRLGVWSKVIAGPDPPWPTDAFTRASSLTVRTAVRNQRRRQIGVGR
jgi:hypothetical protein